jgi:hypothetical protein
MNINISQLAEFANGRVNNQRRTNGMNWGVGDTIQAVLSEINQGKATLRTADDIVFTADASSIQGNVGDTLSFRVNRNGENISLTQIHSNRPSRVEQQERGNASLIDGYAEFKELSNNLENIKENEELRMEYRQEQSAKVAKALAAIRRAQTFLGGMNKSAFSAIVDAGLDFSKISFATLNQVMHHVNKTQDTDPDFAEGLKNNFINPEHARKIIAGLHKHGMNVSEKNIQALESAWERVPEVIPPQAMEKLISAEQDLTLENVYKCVYSSNDVPVPKDTLVNLPPKLLEQFFEREGIQNTEKNMVAAQFLLENDLPISQENISKVNFLKEFTNTEPKNPYALSTQLFFEKAAQFLSMDMPLGNVPLTEVTRFAEIQLRMAVEAAARHQNLNINIDSLREHVKQLTQLELTEDSAIQYLKMAGAGAEPTKVTQLANVYDALANIKPLTANVHTQIMQGEVEFNIKGINDAVKTAQALSQYDQYATVPNPKYGDSFAKVKGQFAPLLEDMGITATSENLKAAFILSKNNVDVNTENLGAVKEIDAKITSISNKLHPMIAAHMLKDGYNPLEMHADQVLDYIKKFNYDMGENGADKISRYIMEMDNAGTLDEDTRKGMIAVYRMLNVIQRDGAKALGLALQMEGLKDSPMTLGDLLNLAQTKRKNIDTNVNDSYGQLESLTRPTESIRGILEAGESASFTYADMLTDSFIDIVQPENLKKMLHSPEAKQQPLENLVAQADVENSENSEISENNLEFESSTMSKELETFISANPEIINLLQGKNISVTAGNIRAYGNRHTLAERLQEAINDDDEDILAETIPNSSLEELQNMQNMEQNPAGQVLANILQGIFAKDEKYADLSSMLAVTHGLNSDGQQGFQIPVKINGRVSTLSMYVLNEKALSQDGADILMTLDTARLGTINTYFKINGTVVDVNVSAQTQEALDFLMTSQGELENLLSATGATLGNLTFSFTQGTKEDEDTETSASTSNNQGVAQSPQTAYDYRV